MTPFRRRLTSVAGDLAPFIQKNPRSVINDAIRLRNEQNKKPFFKDVACVAPEDRPADRFWQDRFPFLVNPDGMGGLTGGPLFGWAPERRTAGLKKTMHQIYIFRLRAELSAAIAGAVCRHASAGLQGFRSHFQKMAAALPIAVKSLQGQSDANLLALFGKASQSPRSEVELELRSLKSRFAERYKCLTPDAVERDIRP